MNETSDAFEKNRQIYLDRLAGVDLESVKDTLGMYEENDGRLVLPFLNRRFFVSNAGIVDEEGQRPDYMLAVILFQYILRCPDGPREDTEWIAFKDLKQTAQFTNINYFVSDTEKVIEKNFSGRAEALRKASEDLGGGFREMETPYDVSMEFRVLPRISLLLLFNDADEEFPAKGTVLFQKQAEFYLDPESLAMASAVLAGTLKQVRL